MTVHAAKGLEFPVVFVVNLARGDGQSARSRFAWSSAAADEDASVAVGDFQSEADEDQRGEGSARRPSACSTSRSPARATGSISAPC